MANKKNKEKKPKARLPRGFVDRSASDIRATDEMIVKIREVYERYGFDPVETPMFEYTDCLGKFLPDTDRPNAGVFSVQDDDEQWMSLRYDMTAPLARHVAENINEIQLPFRSYRQGYVFRNEKPGPGRFRQFMQFDADSVGAPGVQADAEMCMMMADTMEKLGLKGQYVIRVNNRKVLDGVMEAIGLDGDENAERRLTVLRAIDKLDKFGIVGVRKLLGSGRWENDPEESGDFTAGAGLTSAGIDQLLVLFPGAHRANLMEKIETAVAKTRDELGVSVAQEFLRKKADELNADKAETENNIRQLHRLITAGFDEATASYILDNRELRVLALSTAVVNRTFKDGLNELIQLSRLISVAGYSETTIKIDPSVVRGLEYYTGMVYEAELLFDVTNEKGEKVQFGSVGGGGRYDGLIKRFTGRDVPATGFSIGVSRLMTALKNLGKLGTSEVTAPVLVTVMDGDTEALGEYQKMVQQLRAEGIRAEMYQGNWKKFGNQLKYADRRGCPIAIIQGSDERAAGKIQVKDLIEGRKQAEAIESNEEWREQRPGQFEIDESDLVAEVRKLLKAQGAA